MASRSLCAALIFFVVMCASCCHAQTTTQTFYTFCFWDAFARWRPAPHNFNVSDVPAELCDAVIYSHVTIDNNTGSLKLTEKELQLDPEAKAYSKSGMYNPIWMLPPHRAFREMSELKKRNPKLKLLLAIGGPHETIDHYWQFIPQMHLWRDMVISIAQWVKTYGFDGIVLDFFSGSRTAHDREWKWETAKLIDPFIWEIRQRFKQYLPNWHIILTLPAFDSSNHYLFDINRLSQQVNFFFVKSSDCLEFPQLARLNVSTTMDMSDIDRIELMVKRGAERTRIVLEVPLSGRTYSVTSTGSGRRTLFAGPPGKYTKQQGFLSSFEVCDHLLSGWQQWRSSPDSCPYLKDDEEYVTYEDEESIRNKVSMIIGRKFRGVVVRSVDLDDCNSKCTGKSSLVKMLRSSFDTAAPDKDYPYNPPTASWWDEDIFKLMPTTAPPPKPTTTKPPGLPTRTHNKEPASTMIPTTSQSVTSSITLPASNDPRMVPSTTEKVRPAVRTSTPAIAEEVTATTTQSPSKSSTLAATEAVTSSVTAPASKDPEMVPSTPEKVPPAIKTTTTTIDEEVTVTPAQLPSKSSILAATEAATSFVTVPASKDPGIMSNTPEKVSPAIRTSTPAIGEEVTATTAQLPSKLSTLAATEAVTSSVTAPASKDPGMVPSTPEKVPPAIETTTTTMDEEVTVATTQMPSKSSTLAATGAATSFVTVPASKDPGIMPNTPEKVSPAVRTSTPAIGEEVTATTAQLPSKSSTLAATEAGTSSVTAPASKDPGMVPSTPEKSAPAIKTTTNTMNEEVTVAPAQSPSTSSTLAATEAATSFVMVPASKNPGIVSNTPEKVSPSVKTSTPAIGEQVTVTTVQFPSKSSALAATEEATSSVMIPASKDPGMVPTTPEKVPPAIKTNTTTINKEVTVTPAQLPSTLSSLAATEAASPFVTAPASENPRMGPSTTMKVPRAINTTTPAISEKVTLTPAQLPSKSSTLALTEAASSSVSVPSSNDPRMVPSTTEKMPPAVKTSTPAIGEEVTMTPAQLPPELSTLAATEAATKKSTDEICREDNENALMPHESDCTKYYHCAHSKPHLQNCARGTVFDIERQICNWPAMTNRPECKERKENRRKRMAGRLTSL